MASHGQVLQPPLGRRSATPSGAAGRSLADRNAPTQSAQRPNRPMATLAFGCAASRRHRSNDLGQLPDESVDAVRDGRRNRAYGDGCRVARVPTRRFGNSKFVIPHFSNQRSAVIGQPCVTGRSGLSATNRGDAVDRNTRPAPAWVNRSRMYQIEGVPDSRWLRQIGVA